MATVVLVGTLDTKGAEYRFLREQLLARGVETLLLDVGSGGPPLVEPDVPAGDVAAAAGAELAALTDRGDAVETMARGAAAVVRRLFEEGRLQGIAALGGSGGTSIATRAMQALPVGVPPRSADQALPRPPKRLVPPMTAAAIASSRNVPPPVCVLAAARPPARSGCSI